MELQLQNPKESMVADDSFTAKWSEKRMEGDEGLRTVECLRGRLLAERAASKAANDESEQIAKKVTELEKQLKIEIKSRNKAEKRLKFLMKKLESLNISDVSADESSNFSERSEISSVSSSKSQNQIELQMTQISSISKCVTDTSTFGKRHNCPSDESNLGSLDEAISENSNENVSQKNGAEDDSKKEDGSKYYTTISKSDNEEHNVDNNVDNALALVLVEKKVRMAPRNDEDHNEDTSMALVVVVKEEEGVPISNGNVKDALRNARESLQTSMDMKRNNIHQARLDRIAC